MNVIDELIENLTHKSLIFPISYDKDINYTGNELFIHLLIKNNESVKMRISKYMCTFDVHNCKSGIQHKFYETSTTFKSSCINNLLWEICAIKNNNLLNITNRKYVIIHMHYKHPSFTDVSVSDSLPFVFAHRNKLFLDNRKFDLTASKILFDRFISSCGHLQNNAYIYIRTTNKLNIANLNFSNSMPENVGNNNHIDLDLHNEIALLKNEIAMLKNTFKFPNDQRQY